MNENEIAKIVVDAALYVHKRSGPGLLESVYEVVYEVVLAHHLRKHGLKVERQVPVPIRFDDLVFDEGFRTDLLIDDKVIVELKSVEQLAKVRSKQVLTQLRMSGLRLGLLINFGEVLLKDGLHRIANGMPESFTL
jgi:GxxExxY protein